jgi:tannase/feruloyl esterase
MWNAIRSSWYEGTAMKSDVIGRRLGGMVLLLAVAMLPGPFAAADAPPPETVTRAQFEAWLKEISNWGRRGKDAELATLNRTSQVADPRLAGATTPPTFEDACSVQAMQAVASRLPIAVSVQQLPPEEIPGPFLPGGVTYTPASGSLPAYCQITGSFVTNPQTGKTASWLATLPANWNGRYLQLGCAGHCGTFAVSNAALPTIAITNQGKPGDIISRGFASFATDEGHAGFTQGQWAVKGPGQIDEEAVEDFLYRSHKVLARMGKAFATAFYRQLNGSPEKIERSYFAGCSGGGRDALVAASYFPEEFDGIVSGSPYANMATKAFQFVGTSLAAGRSEDANVPADLVAQIRPIVMAQCDALDGVKDGLIQNPMACNFRPDRDLPRCTDDRPGAQCFTKAQRETVSTLLTAVTDERGHIVQPGFSVSEMQNALLVAPSNPASPAPWPEAGNPGTGAVGGMALLGDTVLRIFAHKNDPSFQSRSVISFGSVGPGLVTGYRIKVPSSEVARVHSALRMGIGAIPENVAKLISLDRKLLIWSNLSDQLLTPYMAVNYYKRLAAMYGGYDKLQRHVRLFALPGTAHCSGGGFGGGPGSFDALGAMVDWVEHARAPDGLEATLYDSAVYGVDYTKPKGRTMPLCTFPTMARYSGRGDVNAAANWSCPAGDRSMLTLGESGRQAGVIK